MSESLIFAFENKSHFPAEPVLTLFKYPARKVELQIVEVTAFFV
jgi:hypothetical protein